MPLLTLGIYLLFLVAPRFDPGRSNYVRFWRPYWIMRLATVVVLALKRCAVILGLYLLARSGVSMSGVREPPALCLKANIARVAQLHRLPL